jgi:membrane protease YdiL (CAAX protease family)
MFRNLFNENDLETAGKLTKRGQVIEILIFISLILPAIILSSFQDSEVEADFIRVSISTIFKDISLVALILFFIWRNKEPVQSIGWSFKNGWIEIGLGLLLFFPMIYAAGFLENILFRRDITSPAAEIPDYLLPVGWGERTLAILLIFIVSVAEETIFRGYLFLRFKNIFRNPYWAVAASTLLFALGHGYEGTRGVITVGFMGLIFALIYLWRKSLLAPITMHFLQNFIGIILYPLLSRG